MLRHQEDFRKSVEMVSIDDLVPRNHPLRRIDDAVDWEKIERFAQSFYSPDKGRPCVDPVVLFKIKLLMKLYGFPSLKTTLREADMNIAYRWFLGYGLSAKLPHYKTVGRNFAKRFGDGPFETIISAAIAKAEEEEGRELGEPAAYRCRTERGAGKKANKKRGL